MSVLTFPRHYRAKAGLSGFLLGRIEVLTGCDPNGVKLVERRSMIPHDVHHAYVRVAGDERLLQIIVAPAEAQIEVAVRPVAALFPPPQEAQS